MLTTTGNDRGTVALGGGGGVADFVPGLLWDTLPTVLAASATPRVSEVHSVRRASASSSTAASSSNEGHDS
jgi:hypothetical protein